MDTFYHTIITTYGEKGKQWLQQLPSLVEQMATKWQLQQVQPYKNLSYNYVAYALSAQHNKQVVLKMGCNQQEVNQEAKSLAYYQGHGCVQLLDHDYQSGALLLEHIYPGVSLKTFFPEKDDEAVVHCVYVMQQLHSKKLLEHTLFPTINEWVSLLHTIQTPLISQKHLEKAKMLANDLLHSQTEQVLLHGDLHHENILSSEREQWIAIDPKGVIGDPAYEIGAFIINPIPEIFLYSRLSALLSHRLDLFAEYLAVDRQRLKEWSYVHAVLSACWSINDQNMCKQIITLAELLES